MTRWQRRRLAVLIAVGVAAMTAAMVVLSVVQPGNCPVADVMGATFPSGCQPARLLWCLHIVASMTIAILAMSGTDQALNAWHRRRAHQKDGS